MSELITKLNSSMNCLVSVDFSILKDVVGQIVKEMETQKEKTKELEEQLEISRQETHSLRCRIVESLKAAAAQQPPQSPSKRQQQDQGEIEEVFQELKKTQDELHDLRVRCSSAFGEMRENISHIASSNPAQKSSSKLSELDFENIKEEVKKTQDELMELRKRISDALKSTAPKSVVDEIKKTQDEIMELRKRISSVLLNNEGNNRITELENELEKTNQEMKCLRQRIADAFSKQRSSSVDNAPNEEKSEATPREKLPQINQQQQQKEQTTEQTNNSHTEEQIEAAKLWLRLCSDQETSAAAEIVASSKLNDPQQTQTQQIRPPTTTTNLPTPTRKQRQETTSVSTPRTRELSKRVSAIEQELNEQSERLKELLHVAENKAEVRRVQDVLNTVLRQNRQLGLLIGQDPTSEKIDQQSRDLVIKVEELKADVDQLIRKQNKVNVVPSVVHIKPMSFDIPSSSQQQQQQQQQLPRVGITSPTMKPNSSTSGFRMATSPHTRPDHR